MHWSTHSISLLASDFISSGIIGTESDLFLTVDTCPTKSWAIHQSGCPHRPPRPKNRNLPKITYKWSIFGCFPPSTIIKSSPRVGSLNMLLLWSILAGVTSSFRDRHRPNKVFECSTGIKESLAPWMKSTGQLTFTILGSHHQRQENTTWNFKMSSNFQKWCKKCGHKKATSPKPSPKTSAPPPLVLEDVAKQERHQSAPNMPCRCADGDEGRH